MSKRATPAVAHLALKEYVDRMEANYKALTEQILVYKAKWEGAREALAVYEDALNAQALKGVPQQNEKAA